MMKYGIVIFLCILCIGTMLSEGCALETQEQSITDRSAGTKMYSEVEQSVDKEQSVDREQPGEPETEAEPEAEPVTEEVSLDDSVYIGEYLDSNGSPDLEIARGDDGKYMVQIGFFRLTSLNDGIGELTVDGMKFTATDAAGNPISGVITVEGETATVTFTDSTWQYLPNGSAYEYTKSSDIPNIYIR